MVARASATGQTGPEDGTAEREGDTEGDGTAKEEQQPETEPVKLADINFAVKPYIQLGTTFSATDPTMEVVWHAPQEDNATWSLTFHSTGPSGPDHRATAAMTVVDIPELKPVPAHKQYRALISGLSHGEGFAYDVMKNGQIVFSATLHDNEDAFSADALRRCGRPR